MIILKEDDHKSEKFIEEKIKNLKNDYTLLPLEIDDNGAFII